MEEKGIRRVLRNSEVKKPEKVADQVLRNMKKKGLDYTQLVYGDKTIDIAKTVEKKELVFALKSEFKLKTQKVSSLRKAFARVSSKLRGPKLHKLATMHR